MADPFQLFQNALRNRLTPEQVDAFLASPLRPSFYYGSLMLPSVMSTIIGETDVNRIINNMTPAVLPGYQRYAVRHAPFPAILPSEVPGDSVTGLLSFGLSMRENSEIDLYENGLYNLKEVKVEIELVGGTKKLVDAKVYVWKGCPHELVEAQEKVWSIQDFLDTPF